MTPDEFLAEVTRIVTLTAKDLWRSEPLSEEELSSIIAQVEMLGEERVHGGNRDA